MLPAFPVLDAAVLDALVLEPVLVLGDTTRFSPRLFSKGVVGVDRECAARLEVADCNEVGLGVAGR